MALPEQEPRSKQENEAKQEKGPIPYCRAARFKNEQIARKIYFQAQDAIETPECDLSAYRFHINYIYHVAVLGESPTEELDQKLQTILSPGEPISLPSNVLKVFVERRNKAIKQGPWVERHFRPGWPMR